MSRAFKLKHKKKKTNFADIFEHYILTILEITSELHILKVKRIIWSLLFFKNQIYFVSHKDIFKTIFFMYFEFWNINYQSFLPKFLGKLISWLAFFLITLRPSGGHYFSQKIVTLMTSIDLSGCFYFFPSIWVTILRKFRTTAMNIPSAYWYHLLTLVASVDATTVCCEPQRPQQRPWRSDVIEMFRHRRATRDAATLDRDWILAAWFAFPEIRIKILVFLCTHYRGIDMKGGSRCPHDEFSRSGCWLERESIAIVWEISQNNRMFHLFSE